MDWRDRGGENSIDNKKEFAFLYIMTTTVYDSLKKKSASVITFGKE